MFLFLKLISSSIERHSSFSPIERRCSFSAVPSVLFLQSYTDIQGVFVCVFMCVCVCVFVCVYMYMCVCAHVIMLMWEGSCEAD